MAGRLSSSNPERKNLAALRGKSAGRALSLRVIPWYLPYNRGKSTQKPQPREKHGKPSVRVVEKCQFGTIRCVNMAALRAATTVPGSLVSKPIWQTGDVYNRLDLRQYISTKLHGIIPRNIYLLIRHRQENPE